MPPAGARVFVEGRQDARVAEAERVHGQGLFGCAVEQGAPGFGRERGKWRVQTEAEGLPRDREEAGKRRVLYRPPNADRALAHSQMRHYDPLAIDAQSQP